jgi:hypothetical protein
VTQRRRKCLSRGGLHHRREFEDHAAFAWAAAEGCPVEITIAIPSVPADESPRGAARIQPSRWKAAGIRSSRSLAITRAGHGQPSEYAAIRAAYSEHLDQLVCFNSMAGPAMLRWNRQGYP